MIGLGFDGFLILLVVAIAASATVHYGFRFRVRTGFDSYLGALVVAYIGGWLGAPLFGHWFAGLQFGGVYLVPAILGAIALHVLVVDAVKSGKSGSGAGSGGAATAGGGPSRGGGGTGPGA